MRDCMLHQKVSFSLKPELYTVNRKPFERKILPFVVHARLKVRWNDSHPSSRESSLIRSHEILIGVLVHHCGGVMRTCMLHQEVSFPLKPEPCTVNRKPFEGKTVLWWSILHQTRRFPPPGARFVWTDYNDQANGDLSTKGRMWGYPRFVLGAIGSFLEPFYGHLSPKIDKVA